MAKLVMCNGTAWVSESQMVYGGRLYRADDPIVLDNPDCFDDDLSAYVDPPIVETATAEPGEVRRGPGRPAKVSQ